ncbi:MAG: 2-amino-4-hydroxy-6-hydroxymethyldihydropteridine diphosphokinase [Bacteroidales bacterium]|jgi:2-amino-4-hydroxy-6-hydroxymethyldihydropteridine diphosphokinase|nr:2-amino-4-hydroxy-6-hydroxymethyldihydropteridine diphosphokinase [Bacteroidales bacterium]MCI2122427.1 2-amino-4-hydroxy-6-hydroxymethyldihydropteridine diphosphokinase [Bacteroidales bacterium]MCI2145004.1 2-amino-4-hydroxy-6-hydroxymethyldihydropteridine diphosphokinase [Bacteroidales bacterium]
MVYLSLGSNLGDRALHLAQARMMLQNNLDVRFLCYPIVETKADGFFKGDAPDFLNQLVAFSARDTDISPHRLLGLIKIVETTLGRPNHTIEYDSEGHRIYSNRIIDIDIIRYDSVTMDSPDLTIPHPVHFDIPKIIL